MPSCAALFIAWLYLPDSPRLAYIKGDTVGAAEALRFIAAGNRDACPLDAGYILTVTPTCDLRVEGEPASRMFERRLRRTSLLLAAIWFSLSFGWYGLVIWLPVRAARGRGRICVLRCVSGFTGFPSYHTAVGS
jgi:MFS transporter, putative metabolite:H+ symporter